MQVWFLGQKDPLEEDSWAWQPTLESLPGESQGQSRLASYSTYRCRVGHGQDRSNSVHTNTYKETYVVLTKRKKFYHSHSSHISVWPKMGSRYPKAGLYSFYAWWKTSFLRWRNSLCLEFSHFPLNSSDLPGDFTGKWEHPAGQLLVPRGLLRIRMFSSLLYLKSKDSLLPHHLQENTVSEYLLILTSAS